MFPARRLCGMSAQDEHLAGRRRIRSALRGRNGALTLPCSRRSPTGWISACSMRTGTKRGSRSPRSTASSGTATCRCSPGAALRLPGPRAVGSGRGQGVQPEQAAPGSLRQGGPRHGQLGRPCSGTRSGFSALRPSTSDSAPHTMRSVVVDPVFNWGDDRPPQIAYPDSVLVRGPRPRPDAASSGDTIRAARARMRGWPTRPSSATCSAWASPRSS